MSDQGTEQVIESAGPQVEIQEETPVNFHEVGQEFNKRIAELIKEFEKILPNMYMIKIFQNVSTDLIIRQANYQILYELNKLHAIQEESKSKIIKV